MIRFIVAVAVWLPVALFAITWLGFGGVNSLIDGLTADPNDWSAIVWGIIRAWFAIPVLWVTTVLAFIVAFDD